MGDLTTATLNSKICSNVGEKFQRQLIKLAIGSIQQLDVDQSSIDRIKSENDVSEDDFCDLIGIYTVIVNLFMQSDKEEFEEKLLANGYTQTFIDKLPLKHESKGVLLTNVEKRDASSDLNINYKIDVSLSNNVLNRVVPPWVIINLKNDNKDITFSVDISTFHQLRYNVALLLKELNTLKNSNLLKK